MRLVLLRLLAFAVLLIPLSSAHANFKFGTDEDLHLIQDVTLTGAKQEALYLGYMTRSKYFLLGMYVEDAGYVLGVKGEGKRYYEMPKGEDLARFQRAGHLPNPLPPYKLGFFDYLVGYSLWWASALVVGLLAWSAYRRMNAAPPDEATPTAASAAAPASEAAPGSATTVPTPEPASPAGASPTSTPPVTSPSAATSST